MQKQTLSSPCAWTELADRLVLVNLDITCWSGKKSLTPEDLGLDRAQLPPETLVSLGDKQLVDPERLRAFTSIRSSARRRCLAVGTRFMAGYAVPDAKARDLLDALDALGADYAVARAAFLADYEAQIGAWADRQPAEWQGIIRGALVPVEHVGGRLTFAVQAARVRAPEPDVTDHGGLAGALGGLGDQIVRDVGQVARETLKKSFEGREAVTGLTLGPLRAIRDKLDGLSFVDSRFGAVVADLERLLAGVGDRTAIEGAHLAACRQFLCLAAQPDGLWTYAGAATEVGWTPPGDLFDGAPAAVAAPVPAVPPRAAGGPPAPATLATVEGEDDGWYFA